MVKNNNLMYKELRKRLEMIADTIGADYKEIPFMADNKAWGRSYIEIDQNMFKIVEYDYAHYIKTITFDNVEDLVFEITKSLISSVVSNKLKGFDNGQAHSDRRFRGRLFELYIEYAGKISSDYELRMREKINQILIEHPYHD